MKTCPISNHPIDIMTIGRGAYQVTCPASKWMTALFSDIDDAIEFRASMNLAKLVAEAKREVSKDGTRVRLRGNGFFTTWMTPAEMTEFVKAAGPIPAPTPVPVSEPKPKKSRAKAKPEVEEDAPVE